MDKIISDNNRLVAQTKAVIEFYRKNINLQEI